MVHAMPRVTAFEIVGGYVVRVEFDDGAVRTIDFQPVLAGEVFAPLRDRALFEAVRIDTESRTLVWPNGADFDPATLHDWPEHEAELVAMARRWDGADGSPDTD